MNQSSGLGSYGRFKTGNSDSEAGPPLLEVMQLENHRLIYESLPLRSGGKLRDSFCKLFEVVRGAVVSGNAESGDIVWIKMRMKTRFGRDLDFRARARTDESGRYHFRIPYSNERFSPDLKVGESFAVRSASKVGQLVIREEDVQMGNQIEGPDLRF